MKKESNEKLIKSILLAISKNLVQNKDNINKNIENNLKSRLEKSNQDESKYINILKSNVILYKVTIREKERLINSWISNGQMPQKEERKEVLEKLTKKCSAYVQEGIKSGGKTLNKLDVKNLLLYQNIEKDEVKKRLEIEYKTFSIYNDVVSIFINSLKEDLVKDLSIEDNNDVMKLIREEIKKVVNFVVKSCEITSLKEESLREIQDEEVKEKIDEEVKEEIEEIEEIEEENICDKVEDEKNNKSKKTGLIAGLIVLGVCVGIGGIYMSRSFNKENTSNKSSQVSNDNENNILNSGPDEYIIEDSDFRYLTVSELEEYSNKELGYIRNEIFARYGYVFDNKEYSEYFGDKNWYSADESFEGDEDYFNEYEKGNIKTIKSIEASKSGKTEKTLTEYYYASDESKEVYKVYAGTYEEEDGAREYIKALELQNIKAEFEEDDEYYLYKVMVGNSNSLEQAQEISKKMQDLSIDTYVLAYNKEYEDEIERLGYLAEEGNYDDLKSGIVNIKKKVDDDPIYIEYKKQLKELFDAYKDYL